MKTYKKELEALRQKSNDQQIDRTILTCRNVFFDFRNHKPILFGKSAVEFIRKHYGQMVALIYSHKGKAGLNFEGWRVVAGRLDKPKTINQRIYFQLESGDTLVWPPRYADEDKRIYPLLGVQS